MCFVNNIEVFSVATTVLSAVEIVVISLGAMLPGVFVVFVALPLTVVLLASLDWYVLKIVN